MNDQYLRYKFGNVVEYCRGLIFCCTDCCKCVRCQKGFMDGNIVPVVCYDMFFCSVECCNYYLGFWQHRWANVPVDVRSLGQIDGKGKGKGKAMVVGRIVARIAGAGAGAGKGGIDPKDVRRYWNRGVWKGREKMRGNGRLLTVVKSQVHSPASGSGACACCCCCCYKATPPHKLLSFPATAR